MDGGADLIKELKDPFVILTGNTDARIRNGQSQFSIGRLLRVDGNGIFVRRKPNCILHQFPYYTPEFSTIRDDHQIPRHMQIQPEPPPGDRPCRKSGSMEK